MSLSQPLVSLPFQLVSLWQALLYYPWLCDGHWEQCLPRLHFFGKHHNPRVRDGHWDACLLRLQRSITIPSSVKVTIPQSVKAIQDFAFADWKSLASVTIPQWRLFGRLPLKVAVLWQASQSRSLWCSLGTLPSQVPILWQSSLCKESVTAIGEGAFEGCKSLASITIPE